MTRWVGMVLAAILLVLSCAPVAFAAPQPAFRDLYWGDPAEKLGETVVLYDEQSQALFPGIEFRAKVHEDMQLGSLQATSIVYAFFQNRLMMVSVTVKDAKMLSQVARAKYGLPKKSNQFMIDELYLQGDTYCTVKENLVTKEGFMVLMSATLLAEYENWKKKQAEEAAKSF